MVVSVAGVLSFREAARIGEMRGLGRSGSNMRGLSGDRRVGIEDAGKTDGWENFVMGLDRR